MMMNRTAAQIIGQARIASLRDQARRDALVRTARQSRRPPRQYPERRAAEFLTAFAGRVLRRRPAPGSA
jgi:hypothetical protein